MLDKLLCPKPARLCWLHAHWSKRYMLYHLGSRLWLWWSHLWKRMWSDCQWGKTMDIRRMQSKWLASIVKAHKKSSSRCWIKITPAKGIDSDLIQQRCVPQIIDPSVQTQGVPPPSGCFRKPYMALVAGFCLLIAAVGDKYAACPQMLPAKAPATSLSRQSHPILMCGNSG